MPVTRRLVVRRTRLTDKRQLNLWPDWRHFGFLPDLDMTAIEFDKFHRRHAVVELAVHDFSLKRAPNSSTSRLATSTPTRHGCKRGARAQHDLLDRDHWQGRVDNQLFVARTPRTRLLTIPGRLVNRSGRPTLRMPTNWPWATSFTTALEPSAHSNPPPVERQSCGQAHQTRTPSADNYQRHDGLLHHAPKHIGRRCETRSVEGKRNRRSQEARQWIEARTSSAST